ncbi:hypothetical protein FB451DRAFT_1408489 [Mycena latifolia]|nr:hypothetical protein FB451DRAFT_1408489 [Mycena latifolia]
MPSYTSVHLRELEDSQSLIQPQGTVLAPEMDQSAFDKGSPVYEKDPEASPLPHRSRFEVRAFLLMFLGWPALVIGGQPLLQGAAWSFFAVVELRAFIALPHWSAVWAQANPHLVTLLSTLISTVLAACSSFLFSFDVRRSIALHLREPMSLAAFVSTVNISTHSLVLHQRKWKWSVMSIGMMLLTGVQTSVFPTDALFNALASRWSTFLTPAAIAIETPVTGSELDLSSPALHQMYNNSLHTFKACIVNSSVLPAFIVGGAESGYALAKHSMGLPASSNLMDQTFNTSTAGILPALLRDVNASTYELHHESAKYVRILGSHSMTIDETGFSADVASEFTWAYTTNANWGLMLGCGIVSNYTLIFPLPKITKVNVDYSDPLSTSGTIGTSVTEGQVWDPDGPTGYAALIVMSTQSSTAKQEAPIQDNRAQALPALTIIEVPSLVDPSSWFSGSRHNILGWRPLGPSSAWVLIPGALVALATITVVIGAVAQHACDPPTDPFGLSDALHLVAVAAAGGLSDAFTGTSEKDIQAAERVTVVLRSFPRRGPALVRTDNTSPRFM